MNFNKNLRNKRQELFDIHNRFELIPYEFDGNKKQVYSNFNFSIFVDDYCNADCKFCVAQLRYENKSQMYKKYMIKNDEEYFNRLKEVLIRVRPLNPSISITGGEPTKSKRLVGILNILKEFNFRKKCITTNGSGLLDIVEGKTILQHLIDCKFNHLNISRPHWDNDKVQDIMKFECKNNITSNEDLKYIIPYSLKNNLRPRLSCLLLREGVSNVKQMKEYMDFYKQYGIDNVIFRELMDYNEETNINIEKMEYCKNNKIKLNDIWSELDKDNNFIPTLQNLGYYYYVEVRDYKGITCVSESADLRVCDKEKENNPDIVYEMIFHPNGKLNGSWVDTEDILMDYKSE